MIIPIFVVIAVIGCIVFVLIKRKKNREYYPRYPQHLPGKSRSSHNVINYNKSPTTYPTRPANAVNPFRMPRVSKYTRAKIAKIIAARRKFIRAPRQSHRNRQSPF